MHVIGGRRSHHLSPEWEELYQRLPKRPKAALRRFIGWLSERGVFPNEVSDEVVERFAADVDAFSMRGKPHLIVGATIYAWNIAVTAVLGWPQHKLTKAPSSAKGSSFPLRASPPTSRSRSPIISRI